MKNTTIKKLNIILICLMNLLDKIHALMVRNRILIQENKDLKLSYYEMKERLDKYEEAFRL